MLKKYGYRKLPAIIEGMLLYAKTEDTVAKG